MISKIHRFHGRGSLNFVYNKGRSVRSPALVLRYAGSREADYRLAVVVSKKVSKSAVVRNRIRRRIYEIVRCQHKEVGTKWPYDLVLSVYDVGLADCPSKDLENQVVSLLKKAKIII